MAIARKPQSRNEAGAAVVDVEALIAKGGSVSQPESGVASDETASFTLRVPKKLLAQIDGHLKSKPIKTNRQYWILEALVEKLAREAE